MVVRRVRMGDKITIGNNWSSECGDAVIASASLHGPEGSIQFGEQTGDKFAIYEIEPLQLGIIDLSHEVQFSDGRTGSRQYRLEVHG